MTGVGGVHIALLRGINVGGHGKLPMAALREILTQCGALNPRTYIQSGNAVFRGKVSANEIVQAVEKAQNFRPRVMVLSAKDFSKAVDLNPFKSAEAAPKTLHLYFLAEPSAVDAATLDAVAAPDEHWHLSNQVFYLHTPSGFRNSKIAERAERLLGVAATARNWNTVTKLVEMSRDQ